MILLHRLMCACWLNVHCGHCSGAISFVIIEMHTEMSQYYVPFEVGSITTTAVRCLMKSHSDWENADMCGAVHAM